MNEMSLIEFDREVSSHNAVLIYGLDGWTDIGLAATTALSHLRDRFDAVKVGTFDSDELIDYRARRPVFDIDNGRSIGLEWPSIDLFQGQIENDRDVFILSGPEPDARWRLFTDEVVALARRFDVSDAVGVGSFPAPVPHTRPVALVATSDSTERSAAIGITPGRIQVPGGAQAALELSLASSGCRVISLWARIPHYLSGMAWPAGALSLVEGIEKVLGISIDSTKLAGSASEARDRINELVQASEETREYVARLESQEHDVDQTTLSEVSGDEIAREVEQFLASRDNRERPGGSEE